MICQEYKYHTKASQTHVTLDQIASGLIIRRVCNYTWQYTFYSIIDWSINNAHLLFSIVGSYESTNCPSTNWIVKEDFPVKMEEKNRFISILFQTDTPDEGPSTTVEICCHSPLYSGSLHPLPARITRSVTVILSAILPTLTNWSHAHFGLMYL